MTSTKIEFDVQMTCQKCVESIQKQLSNLKGVTDFQVLLEQGSVIVETNLPYSVIQEAIEVTGRKAVLKGYGEPENSAVSMLGGDSGYCIGSNVKGVIRFIQSKEGCIIDGTLDGLTSGYHGLHIHECGDLSNGCKNIGDHFNPYNAPHGDPNDDLDKRHLGDLGNVKVDESGRARFKILDKYLKVQDIIGRSLSVTEKKDDLGKGNSKSKVDGNSGDCLACGIIARSSGIFQNSKKICACDGNTIWDERDLSLKKEKNDAVPNKK